MTDLICVPSYCRDTNKLKKLYDIVDRLNREVIVVNIHSNFKDGIGDIGWKENNMLSVAQERGTGFYRVDLDCIDYIGEDMFEMGDYSPYDITIAYNEDECVKYPFFRGGKGQTDKSLPLQPLLHIPDMRYFEVAAAHSPIRYFSYKVVSKYPKLRYSNIYKDEKYSQGDNLIYYLKALDMGFRVGVDSNFKVVHPHKHQ